MRLHYILLAALLAGCTGTAPPTTTHELQAGCTDQPLEASQLYLAEGYTLANASGPMGEAPANEGHEAFTKELRPWLSAPVSYVVHMEGNVTIDLDLGLRGVDLAPGRTEFYIQFGSDRAFVPAGLFVPSAPSSPVPHQIHVHDAIALPEGGFTLEPGDRYSLLVTSLVEGGDNSGAVVQYGDGTNSTVAFGTRCGEPQEWLLKRDLASPVILPGNQGLFTGAVPPVEGVNRRTVPFELEQGTSRLTVMLRQLGGAGPKNDMDLYLLAPNGTQVYAATSPSANETMILWPENLAAFLPPGPYQVRIESYSGTNYTGKLTIRMEESEEHAE